MNNKLKSILIDDEPLARKDLKVMLEKLENVEIVGEFACITAAEKFLQNNMPDIIFLDIDLQTENGFDLFNGQKLKSKIIFVTAFDEYALKAFDVNALDYILKPVTLERLNKALERFSEIKLDNESEGTAALCYNDCIYVDFSNTMQFVRLNEISHIVADNYYTKVVLKNGKWGLVHKSMKEWERRLPEKYFVRIHRSTIINIESIEKIEPWFNNAQRVFLKGIQDDFLISRRYASKIKKLYK